MNEQHKHAEFIKAWANGAEIQYRDPNCNRPNDWVCVSNPDWKQLDYEFRISEYFGVEE